MRLTVLSAVVAMPVLSMDAAQIFKFTDNDGKITYSTSIPEDFIEAEEIQVAGAPSKRYIAQIKQMNGELKAAAQQLTDAREERQSLRDEKEKKRLERLALINRSKPPVAVYQPNNYVTYPYRFGRARHYSGYRHPGKPAHLPAATRSYKHNPPPAGGASRGHHR